MSRVFFVLLKYVTVHFFKLSTHQGSGCVSAYRHKEVYDKRGVDCGFLQQPCMVLFQAWSAFVIVSPAPFLHNTPTGVFLKKKKIRKVWAWLDGGAKPEIETWLILILISSAIRLHKHSPHLTIEVWYYWQEHVRGGLSAYEKQAQLPSSWGSGCLSIFGCNQKSKTATSEVVFKWADFV